MEEQKPTIYDFVPPSLNKPIQSNATSAVYGNINEAINVGSLRKGGNLTVKTLSVGGLVKQVAPGDDIQAAIDEVARENGGTVQLLAKTYTLTNNITLRSSVTLSGAGRDLTILDFNNQPYGITSGGTSASALNTNIAIDELSVKNSTAAAAIDFNYTDSFLFHRITVTACTQKGIRIQHSQIFVLDQVRSKGNTGNGFEIVGDSSRTSARFSINNCFADGNGGIGFAFIAGTGNLNYFEVTSCVAGTNTNNGYDLAATGNTALDATFSQCIATTNGGVGFNIAGPIQRATFLGCAAESNTGNGFTVAGINNIFIGNQFANPFVMTGSANVVIGNVQTSASDPTTAIVLSDNGNFLTGNYNGSKVVEKKIYEAKNTSGSALRIGNVVIMDSTTDGQSVTTTTTAGSNKVFGMAIQAINNAAFGDVLTEGYTSSLFVSNLAASIAVGDWLSTFTAAYYAKKAVAGDTVFAMALSAPSTGTAQINALLVSPRLI